MSFFARPVPHTKGPDAPRDPLPAAVGEALLAGGDVRLKGGVLEKIKDIEARRHRVPAGKVTGGDIHRRIINTLSLEYRIIRVTKGIARGRAR